MDKFGAEVVASLQNAAKQEIRTKTLPAFKQLGELITTEYFNHLRPVASLGSVLNGGANLYRNLFIFHTTLLDVEAIDMHEDLKKVVTAIRGKMEAIFSNEEWRKWMDESDESFKSPQEFLGFIQVGGCFERSRDVSEL